jgi:hypothetical protein
MWQPSCEIERIFLHSLSPPTTVIQTPVLMRHGTAINFAVQWAYNHGFSTITLIEPDCMIRGDVWLSNLKMAIRNGNWHAGSVVLKSQAHAWEGCFSPPRIWPLHPCPSIWLLEKATKLSFKAFWNRDLVYFKMRYVDTAIMAWYKMFKAGKSQRVETPDFVHFWSGSYAKRRIGEKFNYIP